MASSTPDPAEIFLRPATPHSFIFRNAIRPSTISCRHISCQIMTTPSSPSKLCFPNDRAPQKSSFPPTKTRTLSTWDPRGVPLATHWLCFLPSLRLCTYDILNDFLAIQPKLASCAWSMGSDVLAFFLSACRQVCSQTCATRWVGLAAIVFWVHKSCFSLSAHRLELLLPKSPT
jgi:hypothetical protein